MLKTIDTIKMIFKKELFIEKEGYGDYRFHQDWVDEIDCRTAFIDPETKYGTCGFYIVKQDWCEPC